MAKIAHVSCIEIVGRLKQPWLIASGPIAEISALLVRVEDSEGFVGYGECCSRGGTRVLRTVVEDLLAPRLLGREAGHIAALGADMLATLRTRGHTRGFLLEAISGLDIAFWDLSARRLKQPISALMMGHGRTALDAYASSILIDSPEAMAAEAARLKTAGFKAIKMKIAGDLDADVSRISEVRAALGSGVRLMLDANSGYDAAGAIALCRRIEPYDIYWLEEPMPLDDLPGYRRLRQASSARIALGEGEFLPMGFRPFLEEGLIDVVQPNVTRAGGITGLRRIAALADAFNLPVAPHTGASGPVCMAATLQVGAAIDGFLMHEYMYPENPFEEFFASPPPQPSAGRIAVPQGPGLGADIREDAWARYAAGPPKQAA